jgi:transposase-like protein
MANRTKFTAEKRAAFVSALIETGGNVCKAAKVVGLGRESLYQHRAKNEAFRIEWDAAVERSTDVLLGEAMRRAVKGVRKPIYQQAKRVGYVQEYSDSLLMFLIKGRRPEFKDSARVEINNANTNTQVTVKEQVEKRTANIRDRLGMDLTEVFGDTSGT